MIRYVVVGQGGNLSSGGTGSGSGGDGRGQGRRVTEGSKGGFLGRNNINE